MKRLFLIPLILLFVLPCHARMNVGILGGGGSATPSCSTPVTDNYYTGSTTAAYEIAHNTGDIWRGITFTFAAQQTVCSIKVKMSRVGDISGLTYVGELYNGWNTSLGTLVGTSTVSGDNGWSDTIVTFTFTSPVTVPAATSMAFAIRRSDNSYDGTNYATISLNVTGTQASWGWARWLVDESLSGSGTNDPYGQFYSQ